MSQADSSHPTQREHVIDALRGVSILAVLAYHYHPFNSQISPYGLYGVTLFFMISGYCMLPSLRSSTSIRHFFSKRIARLFPALVACGLASTIIEKLANVHPDRMHSWADWIKSSICLPSIDIPCQLSGLTLGKFHEYSYPDGAYWTLATEFKFYAVIGLIFWLAGSRHIMISFSVVTLCTLLYWLSPSWQSHYLQEIIPYLPIFLAGAAVQEFTHHDRFKGLFGIVSSILAIAYLRFLDVTPYSMPIVSDPALYAYAFCLVLLLTAATLKSNTPSHWLQSLFSPFVFIGLLSYPLYLLHQDIGLVIFALLEPYDGVTLRLIVTPILLITLAFIIHKSIENRFNKPLIRLFMNVPLSPRH